MDEHFDAIVIGMGPGGEVAASRLLAAGRRVAIIERELIGGECAYWACIPSKTLLRPTEARAEAAHTAGLTRPALNWPQIRDYRDYMIRHLDDTAQADGYRKQGATVIKGTARLAGTGRIDVNDQHLTADHILLATGSDANRPSIKGLEDVPVWTNREATTLTDIPERALIIGGSAVAAELGQFLARMGTRTTIVQRGPRLLGREEARLGEIAAEHLAADGIDIRLNTQARAARRDGADTVVELDDGTTVRTDVFVLGAGRTPARATSDWKTSVSKPVPAANSPSTKTDVSPTDCGHSATSPASRCSPTSPSTRPASSPTPSSAHPGPPTTPASPVSSSPNPRSQPSA